MVPVTAPVDFAAAFAKAAPLAILDRERCEVLWGLATRLGAVPGAVAEVGVYKGGTLALLALACPGRAVQGFDTFAGQPPTALPWEGHKAGDFGDTSQGAVAAALAAHPNVTLHPGTFPATAAPHADTVYALAHFDADLYQSCVDFIAWFWPRLAPGGVLVFDDWGWPQCPGVAKAIAGAGLAVVPGAHYQCYALKPRG